MAGMDEHAVALVTELGAAVAGIKTVDGVPVVVLPDGGGERWRAEVVDVEKYQPHPRRKTGILVARDVDSFITYINRHKTVATVAWADTGGGIRCVLNSHEPAQAPVIEEIGVTPLDIARPGWGDHVVVLRREETPGFAAWTTLNGVELTQQQFAEFLEDRIGEITDPSGGELLEVATFFQAHTAIAYTSARQLSNGQVQLQYVEEIKESAGKNGETKVPTEFKILLRPYRDAPPGEEGKPDPNQFIVAAKLRYRLRDQGVRFVFKLSEDIETQLDGVHNAAIERVRAETDVPVLLAGV